MTTKISILTIPRLPSFHDTWMILFHDMRPQLSVEVGISRPSTMMLMALGSILLNFLGLTCGAANASSHFRRYSESSGMVKFCDNAATTTCSVLTTLPSSEAGSTLSLLHMIAWFISCPPDPQDLQLLPSGCFATPTHCLNVPIAFPIMPNASLNFFRLILSAQQDVRNASWAQDSR